MLRRVLIALVLAALIGAGIGLWVTAPSRVDAARLAGLNGDTTRGQAVFTAAGCASRIRAAAAWAQAGL